MGSSVDILSTHNPDLAEEDQEVLMYEKYDPLLHGQSRESTDKILSVDFMRKYIHFVKIMKPTLTEEASEIIAEEYSRLRSEDVMEADIARTQPVTARTLETLIRLATAHAKARMSNTVDPQDADAAIELVQYAYFKKVLEKERRKRRRDSDDSDEDIQRPRTRQRRASQAGGDESEEEEEVITQSSTRSRSQAAPKKTSAIASADTTSKSAEAPEEMDTEPIVPETIMSERLSAFRSHLFRMFRENSSQPLSLSTLREAINLDNAAPFTQTEITSAIEQMAEGNQIMLEGDNVHLI